jgi:hypothetical protein
MPDYQEFINVHSVHRCTYEHYKVSSATASLLHLWFAGHSNPTLPAGDCFVPQWRMAKKSRKIKSLFLENLYK